LLFIFLALLTEVNWRDEREGTAAADVALIVD
jgi:hypothetical protein